MLHYGHLRQRLIAERAEIEPVAAAGVAGLKGRRTFVGFRSEFLAAYPGYYEPCSIARHYCGVAQRGGDIEIVGAVRLLLVETGEQYVLRYLHALIRERGKHLHRRQVGAADDRVRKSVGDYLIGDCGEIAYPVLAVMDTVFGNTDAAALHRLDEVPLNGVVKII